MSLNLNNKLFCQRIKLLKVKKFFLKFYTVLHARPSFPHLFWREQVSTWSALSSTDQVRFNFQEIPDIISVFLA